MAKVKTVTLFVEVSDEHGVRSFVESTEVGSGLHWKRPSEFINEFQKLYSRMNSTKFTIKNIVIG